MLGTIQKQEVVFRANSYNISLTVGDLALLTVERSKVKVWNGKEVKNDVTVKFPQYWEKRADNVYLLDIQVKPNSDVSFSLRLTYQQKMQNNDNLFIVEDLRLAAQANSEVEDKQKNGGNMSQGQHRDNETANGSKLRRRFIDWLKEQDRIQWLSITLCTVANTMILADLRKQGAYFMTLGYFPAFDVSSATRAIMLMDLGAVAVAFAIHTYYQLYRNQEKMQKKSQQDQQPLLQGMSEDGMQSVASTGVVLAMSALTGALVNNAGGDGLTLMVAMPVVLTFFFAPQIKEITKDLVIDLRSAFKDIQKQLDDSQGFAVQC